MQCNYHPACFIAGSTEGHRPVLFLMFCHEQLKNFLVHVHQIQIANQMNIAGRRTEIVATENKYLFILGILQRCGSNYLYNILIRHRDAEPCAQPGEDFIMYTSDGIFESAAAIKHRWHRSWIGERRNFFYKRYLQAIGKGILNYYLCPDNIKNKLVITKTPFSNNIANFRSIFPDVRLIILIRNGKNLIESGVRTFGWNYENAFHNYAESANRILEFLNSEKNHKLTLLLKYEDVFTHFGPTIQKLCRFLDLDPDGFNMHQIENLPVIGSSEHMTKKKKNWDPVDDKTGFNPIKRSSEWNPELHEKFDRICGGWHKKLGY